MKTHRTAVWQGGIKDGKGAISTKSGALKDYPYGFSSRFEGKPGTNPEELIGAETGDERREIFDVGFNGKLLRVAITALRNFQPALEGVADGRPGIATPQAALPATGHATAALPSSVMNSRRLIRSTRRRAIAESWAPQGQAPWLSAC